MKKERGKFLIVMLFLMTISMVFSLYSVITFNYQEVYKSAPSWLPAFNVINVIVDIAALIGIWFWKKIAVYVYTASAILGVLMEAFILRPTEVGMRMSFVGIVFIGLLLLAIYSKWKEFE